MPPTPGPPAGADLALCRIEERLDPRLPPLSRTTWPGTLAPVRALLDGVDFARLTILAGQPGAALWQVDEDGLTPTAWEDLDVVAHWRAFLEAPERYHRHLGAP